MNERQQSNLQFFSSVVDPIPGWLIDYAALRTLDLLDFQEERQISGSLMEIGVYGGKYFSVLLSSAQRQHHQLVGIDPFEHFSEAAVISNLGLDRDLGHQPILIKSLSQDVELSLLFERLEKKTRFVSLDGSHDFEDVFLDLRLAENVLHEEGVIAVDDFLNTECLGVFEAVVKLLSQPTGLAPFMYTSNKLFMCNKSRHQMYTEFTIKSILDDKIKEQSRLFSEKISNNRNWVFTKLCGHSVLIA